MTVTAIARSNPEESFSVVFSLSEAFETSHFVAGQAELAAMHKALSEGTVHQAVNLHGLGGIGMTQLAIAYTKAHRDDYSAIFWLNIKDGVSVKQSYSRLAQRILQDCPSASQLGVFTDDKKQEKVVAAVKRWLEHAKNYDNPKVHVSVVIIAPRNPNVSPSPNAAEIRQQRRVAEQ
jgi:hypothetical protein